ncbi:MAG: glycosyltransferase family 4 protein, partial [Spirochaetia bacterium]|nr:glycosyltransferase family 4 protein [Spirochaetia bacterium]
EGLGTSVLDAMAAGLPVCATEGGGIPEMIDDGRGGFLSPVGDSERLSVSLEKLLKNSSLRKKMSLYNKKKVKLFSRQSTYRQTLEVYKKVISHEI